MAFILNALGFGYSKGNTPDSKKLVLPALIRDEIETTSALKKEVQTLLFNPTQNPLVRAILTNYQTSIPNINSVSFKAEQAHDDNIVAIAEMLPDIPLQQIERTLRYVSGSKEQAIDLLLNNVHITEEMVSTVSHDIDNPQKVIQLTNEIHFLEKQLEEELLKIEKCEKAAKELGVEDLKNMEDNNDLILRKIQFEHSTLQRKMFEEKAAKNTRFYCKGEEQALANNTYLQYTLKKTNQFDYEAEQIHYRLCESQFYRYGGCNNTDISTVTYVVNSEIRKAFEAAKEKLAIRHGFLKESMKAIILFHGTSSENMSAIMKTNFLLSKLGSHTGNKGAYGAGIYFSQFPYYSIGYSRGAQALLMCYVFVGKAYMMQAQVGAALKEGYDSHVSPGDCEVVIYDTTCILPCYRVDLTPIAKPDYSSSFYFK